MLPYLYDISYPVQRKEGGITFADDRMRTPSQVRTPNSSVNALLEHPKIRLLLHTIWLLLLHTTLVLQLHTTIVYVLISVKQLRMTDHMPTSSPLRGDQFLSMRIDVTNSEPYILYFMVGRGSSQKSILRPKVFFSFEANKAAQTVT